MPKLQNILPSWGRVCRSIPLSRQPRFFSFASCSLSLSLCVSLLSAPLSLLSRARICKNDLPDGSTQAAAAAPSQADESLAAAGSGLSGTRSPSPVRSCQRIFVLVYLALRIAFSPRHWKIIRRGAQPQL